MLARKSADLEDVQQQCRPELQEELGVEFRGRDPDIERRTGSRVNQLEERIWKELASVDR
jgi:hypothetical protein